MDIKQWMKDFQDAILNQFKENVLFIGLQGSQAREEAGPDSDIDVVVIFDTLSFEDIKQYERTVESLPCRDRLCGFISGKAELQNWEQGELFQFYYDTIPVYGSLKELIKLDDGDSAAKAVHMGACAIYHGCLHNFLHGKEPAALNALCKAAVFVMQAEHFCKTGTYIHKHHQLLPLLGEQEQRILEMKEDCPANFEPLSDLLISWSAERIQPPQAEKSARTNFIR